MGLVALYPKRNLSLPDQAHKAYPNLLKELVIDSQACINLDQNIPSGREPEDTQPNNRCT